MAVRTFCVQASQLAHVLNLMPSSVSVIGSISAPAAGWVALMLDGPWEERTPIPEVEMRIDDRVAFARSISFVEKSKILSVPKKLLHA